MTWCFYVRWNRKLSAFHSEPLRGREKCPEFCTVEQIFKQTLGIPFRIILRKRKMLRIPFHITKIEANSQNSIPNQSVEEKTTQNFIPWIKNRSKLIVLLRYFDCILKTNFFCVFPFHSVSSFGINSSADLGMPRNEHFLPRNNGNRFVSIPRNFLGTKFRFQS